MARLEERVERHDDEITSLREVKHKIISIEAAVTLLTSVNPAVIANRVQNVEQTIMEVREEVKGMRKALYTVALSVVSGSVLFAFTIFTLIR